MLSLAKPCITILAALTMLQLRPSPMRAAPAAQAALELQAPGDAAHAVQSLAGMQQVLGMLDAEVTHASLAISVANVGVGAANLVGAAFVSHRGVHGASVGAYAGGTAALLTGILGLTVGHRPFHSVYTVFLERQHTLPAAETLAATESAWQAMAASLRKLRRLTGSVLTGVGTALVGLTTTNLIIAGPYPSRSTPPHDRAAFGGAMLGLSGLILVNGVTLLAVPGPVETSWRVYTTLNPPATSPRGTFSLLPTRGGMTAVAALRF